MLPDILDVFKLEHRSTGFYAKSKITSVEQEINPLIFLGIRQELISDKTQKVIYVWATVNKEGSFIVKDIADTSDFEEVSDGEVK